MDQSIFQISEIFLNDFLHFNSVRENSVGQQQFWRTTGRLNKSHTSEYDCQNWLELMALFLPSNQKLS